MKYRREFSIIVSVLMLLVIAVLRVDVFIFVNVFCEIFRVSHSISIDSRDKQVSFQLRRPLHMSPVSPVIHASLFPHGCPRYQSHVFDVIVHRQRLFFSLICGQPKAGRGILLA